MIEDIHVIQDNGDTYCAVPQGDDCWILSWPEGDVRFYGTVREVRKELNDTYARIRAQEEEELERDA